MEEQNPDSSNKTTRKRTRRRSHTRKSPLTNTFINMAEARREIVTALHLHRSSPKINYNNPAVISASRNGNRSLYRQLTDSIPVPEPTWSTTAPAVLCAPVPPIEVLEAEWFDNLSSSYAWWIGFLNSLDAKTGAGEIRPCLDAANNVEKSTTDGNDLIPFIDEWMVYPTAEERRAEQM